MSTTLSRNDIAKITGNDPKLIRAYETLQDQSTVAQQALTTAIDAQTTAGSAFSTAQSAQATASQAETDAQTGIAAASAAQTSADNANAGVAAETARAEAAEALLAPLASPVFTGDPQAPTPATADNDTSIATTAFVKAQGYLTTSGASSTYAPLASPTFTGDPKAPTPTAGDNDTSIATTAFVTGGIATAVSPLAPLASPALTGNPTAPTQATTDNSTKLATTAYVQAQGYKPAANIKMGSAVGTTVTGGKIAISFGVTFPSNPFVMVSNGDGGVSAVEWYSVDYTSITTTGFNVIIASTGGVLAAGSVRRVSWLAMI